MKQCLRVRLLHTLKVNSVGLYALKEASYFCGASTYKNPAPVPCFTLDDFKTMQAGKCDNREIMLSSNRPDSLRLSLFSVRQ